MSDTETAEATTETTSTQTAETQTAETAGAETNTTESKTAETAPATQTPAKPAGYHPIDFKTASPEQIQERFDYVYGQVKHTERDKREMRQILQQQSEIIEQLSQGQQQVVQHLTQQSFTEGKDQLKAAMNEAWKKGDNAGYIEAQNKLMDLQVEERVAAKMQPQQPQKKTNGQVPGSAIEIANRAVDSGELSQDDYRITESWQSERDGMGNLVRPWAYADNPNHQAALFETRSVLANPRFTNLTYEQKLAEVDKRMGIQKPTTGQNVMGGRLTKPAKTTKIELSPKQREIALKTQYAGKGKSEAEHLEKYRLQVEKFQQKRAK